MSTSTPRPPAPPPPPAAAAAGAATPPPASPPSGSSPGGGVIYRRNPAGGAAAQQHPDYTEFGIKIHKLRFTLKVQRRASSCSNGRIGHHSHGHSHGHSHSHRGSVNVDPGRTDRHGRPRLGSEDRSRVARARQQQQQQQQQQAPRRPRPASSSSLADSLRNLDLDSNAGSRRPVVQDCTDGAAMSSSTSSSSRGGAGTRMANWEFQVNKRENMQIAINVKILLRFKKKNC